MLEVKNYITGLVLIAVTALLMVFVLLPKNTDFMLRVASLGLPVKCTFTNNIGQITYSIKGRRSLAKSVSDNITNYVYNDSFTIYTWREGSSLGARRDIVQNNEVDLYKTTYKSLADSLTQQNYNSRCIITLINDNTFEVPEDIRFQNPTKK